VQIECLTRDAIELLKPSLCKAPEAFDAVDMCCASDELIGGVIDSEMLRIANINQAIVAAPAVTVDDSFGSHATANNGLQRGFLAVRDDLRIDTALAFEDAEDDGFTCCTSASLATHTASTEVRLINFDFALGEGRGAFAFFRDALSDFEKDCVDRLALKTGQLSCSAGCQIERKVTQHSQKFTLRNFGTPVITV